MPVWLEEAVVEGVVEVDGVELAETLGEAETTLPLIFITEEEGRRFFFQNKIKIKSPRPRGTRQKGCAFR